MASLPFTVLDEVSAFLAGSPLTTVIGGEDARSAGDEVIETRDPGSGRLWPPSTRCSRRTSTRQSAPWPPPSSVPVGRPCCGRSGRAAAPPGRRRGSESRGHRPDRARSTPARSSPRPPATWRTSSRRWATSRGMSLHVPRHAARPIPKARSLDGAVPLGPVRIHLPLELPVPADRLGHRPRVGGGQHRRRQAGRGHAAVGDLLGPARARGGHSRRRNQRRPRPGEDRRGRGACPPIPA